jgi:hypothetical protein
MRKFFLAYLLILLATAVELRSQENASSLPAQLEKLFGRLRENIPAEDKLKANDSILSLVSVYASTDTVFKHRFSKLRFLGQITSPDSLVKLITWNLILDDGENSYYLYVIRRNGKTGGGAVTALKAVYRDIPPDADSAYSKDNWYGSLYYEIRPFKAFETTRYLVLGIDYGSSFITRKVIDVLSFDQAGIPVFGNKCFSDGKVLKSRVVFQYSSSAVMSLKFDNDRMIVFDHLSPVSAQYTGNYQFYGPDFSFDSFTLDNGIWRYKGDIDIKNK